MIIFIFRIFVTIDRRAVVGPETGRDRDSIVWSKKKTDKKHVDIKKREKAPCEMRKVRRKIFKTTRFN